uniref:Peroxiredoxin-6 n=1 Tax=Apis cerana TaxID=7461 RepID=V9IEA6_APICE
MRINSIVPNFEADTTQGQINFYDWQGDSWVVLFSHPADFTPVCTTELGRLAVHQPHFKRRNTKLLAHSVDKLQDHVDWVNDIKSYCQDIPGAFPYPIIADHDRTLAVKLDMIDEISKDDPEQALTVRALYIISPDHRLRLSMHYPTSTGRNVDQVKKL